MEAKFTKLANRRVTRMQTTLFTHPTLSSLQPSEEPDKKMTIPMLERKMLFLNEPSLITYKPDSVDQVKHLWKVHATLMAYDSGIITSQT